MAYEIEATVKVEFTLSGQIPNDEIDTIVCERLDGIEGVQNYNYQIYIVEDDNPLRDYKDEWLANRKKSSR